MFLLFNFVMFSSAFVFFISAYQFSNTSVFLSGAAYCSKENYKTMVLAGPAEGFVVHSTLYHAKSDLQGYTGVMPSTKTIYVVFRGSSSLLNWLDDFKFLKTEYLTYPSCQCLVHKGFYGASNGLKSQVFESVTFLQKKYGYKDIVVTGHSLGAAIAQLIMMELSLSLPLSGGLYSYNFGQPRIGDAKYAGFVNTIIDEDHLLRFTHNKDMVPHVPPVEMGYLHSCREVFEDENGKIKECSNVNCEDALCADQYSFMDTNTDDHSIYLQHIMSCESSVY